MNSVQTEWVDVSEKDIIVRDNKYKDTDYASYAYTNVRHVLFPPIAKSHFDITSPHYLPLYHDAVIKYQQTGVYSIAGL